MGKIRVPFKDYGNEVSTSNFTVDNAISDANITVVVNAVDGITVDGRQTAVLVQETEKDAGISGKATSPLAQREIKWLARYVDDTTNTLYQLEIPCADLSLLSGDTDFLSLGSGAGLAFKTAFDAQQLSPVGNSCTLQSVQFVGRNY